jgi:hypothetical protein
MIKEKMNGAVKNALYGRPTTTTQQRSGRYWCNTFF